MKQSKATVLLKTFCSLYCKAYPHLIFCCCCLQGNMSYRLLCEGNKNECSIWTQNQESKKLTLSFNNDTFGVPVSNINDFLQCFRAILGTKTSGKFKI